MQHLLAPTYMSEVHALISLIEDPDEQIYEQVRTTLKGYGEVIIPQLEQYWELEKFGPLFQKRVEELITSIHYDSVYNRLKNWKNSPDQSLLEGALIINRYQYPGFDEEEVRHVVSKIRQDIWLELNDHLTSFEIVRVMNHMLFKVYGFHGNRDNYHDPRNSFFTDIIASRRGNPLSLGILYTHIAKSLDLPIFGVNLPSHFILCYLDYHPEFMEMGVTPEESDVMFYINPFQDGAILQKTEIDEFLALQKIDANPSFYRPCSNVAMISRMLNNLIHGYIAQEKDDKVRELKTLLSVLLEE
jgi:regulator of sirC expression with transglutaminase-like and TPR domain